MSIFCGQPRGNSRANNRVVLHNMRKSISLTRNLAALVLAASLVWPADGWAAADNSTSPERIVGQVIRPMMSANDIPGMAVGILINGETYVFDYGLASAKPKRPVTDNTLFEIGSISKTFNATLAAYAQLHGDLSLTGMASTYMPNLRGTAFDKVSLVDLGTYTPGGMPLMLPSAITDDAQLMAYYRAWRPTYSPGSVRTYSNPSIGLLGLISASRMHADYSEILQAQMFPAFGLRHSFMNIPPAEMKNYAQGFEDDGTPIRIKFDPLTPETGGVRITAGDLLRFLAINMEMIKVDASWQRAVMATHTGYDRLTAGTMVQDLVWEQLDLPVSLASLQAANSEHVLFDPNEVTPFSPPLPPKADALLNKTGSTNGFAAYVAFIPKDKVAIVLLANKDYPISARVRTAFAILTQIGAAGLFHGQ
jgi:beta-lactamase class C